MIRGHFSMGRPSIDGLLVFPVVPRLGREPAQLALSLLVDTGADTTTIVPAHYQRAGLRYADFSGFPRSMPTGFGGTLEARSVPLALFLRHEDGRYDRLVFSGQVVKPAPHLERVTSVLGRDVIDNYRLTIDLSVELVSLETVAADSPD